MSNGSGGSLEQATGVADPLLALSDLRAGYGETDILNGVTLDVERGEIVSLIGRNGVGKTTTLRTVAGGLPIRDGDIVYAGESLAGLSTTEVARCGIAFVPEARRVFPGLTVEENLRMGVLGGRATGGWRGSDETGPDAEPSSSDRGEWTMESVYETFDSLAGRRHNQAAQLSGGEQQMLAIARALLTDPDLLLLDEPTEGLAPVIVDRVQELVETLNGRGLTVLLVEQNVRVARALADRHYILDKGTVVYSGTTEDLDEDEAVLDRHLGVSAD